MSSPSADPGQLVRALERFGPHDHLCSIYENQQEHFGVAVPFIRIGLDRHEKCLYIMDAESMDGVRDAMKAGGIDVAAAVGSGALTIATKDQTYMRRGSFDPDWMFSFWQEAAEQAQREGFTSLRATGETEWVVRGGPGLERWMEYECRLTHALAESNAFALCQYNRNLFPPSLILDVIRTHPVVIYRDTACRNFYFVPPEEFLGDDPARREVQRLLNNIRDRERLDDELSRAHAELEQRVLDRTRELREREEWLRLAQSAAGLGIADWDVRSDHPRYTEELFRIYGLDPTEQTLTYAQWIDRLHPDDRSAVRAGISAAFEGRRSWEGEFRIVLPDATVRWIAAKAVIFFDEQGKPTRLIAANTDISERKRAEEAHFNAQKLNSIGLLAGGIAHDFNNILTGVLGNASLLRQEAPRRLGPRIDEIIHGAEKAADLTRQLLAYAGKGRFVLDELDVSVVVRDMTDLLRLTVPKNLALKLDLAEKLPLITADAGQVEQIVMNLVTNAAEAIGSDTAGTVTLKTGVAEPGPDCGAAAGQAATGEYVYLQVTDTGCGMDEATKANIFDPFFSTKFTGRGLGLAAVSGIVRAHGGFISVTTAPGLGSTFRVYLRPTAVQPRGRGMQGAKGTAASSAKVLVVDDEECVRQVAGAVLRNNGYNVVFASDGQEAMMVFQEQCSQIEVVLLDLVLPALHGAQVLERMRRLKPGVKVLLTSGYAAQEAERLCGPNGARAFLQKPFTAEGLVEAVRSVIQ